MTAAATLQRLAGLHMRLVARSTNSIQQKSEKQNGQWNNSRHTSPTDNKNDDIDLGTRGKERVKEVTDQRTSGKHHVEQTAEIL